MSARWQMNLIVRGCCEAEPADPDHGDTICINVNDLQAIVASALGVVVLSDDPTPGSMNGDPAEPRDDSDRHYRLPIGFLPAYELTRLNSGHDARLRSGKFGPSALDGDIPVYIDRPGTGS